MKFTIKRSKWYRGQDIAKSRLLLETGEMCCLGFLAKELGYSDNEILNIGTPQSVMTNPMKPIEVENKWPWALVNSVADAFGGEVSNTNLTDRIIGANDRCDISSDEREASLKKLFLEGDIEAMFED